MIKTARTADYAWYGPLVGASVLLAPDLGATNASAPLLASLEGADAARLRQNGLARAASLVYARSPHLGDAVDTGCRGLRNILRVDHQRPPR